LIVFLFFRAQPPEIVSKAATTNLFGTRNEEEEQQDDVLSPGWLSKFFRLIDF
jgi:hypothetical protein